MALPIIANTYRVTINGAASNGIAPVNVFHVRSTAGTGAAVAALLDGLDTVELWYPVPDDFQPATITVIKLDGAESSITIPTDWIHANGSGDYVPEACAVVSLYTGLRGPANRGRMFIGPCEESAIANGKLLSTPRSNMQTAVNDWVTGMGESDVQLVVASYKDEIAHDCLSQTVKTDLGMQKRRLIDTRS